MLRGSRLTGFTWANSGKNSGFMVNTPLQAHLALAQQVGECNIADARHWLNAGSTSGPLAQVWISVVYRLVHPVILAAEYT